MHRFHSKIALRWRHMSISPALSRWIEKVQSNLMYKLASKRIASRWQNVCLYSAVTKWQQYKCDKMLVRQTAEHTCVSILTAPHFELWISNTKRSSFLRRQAVLRSFVNLWLLRTGRMRRKALDSTGDLSASSQRTSSFGARSELGSARTTPAPTHVDVDPRQERMGESEHSSSRQTSASPLRSCQSSASQSSRRVKIGEDASEDRGRCADRSRSMNSSRPVSRRTSPLSTGNRSFIHAHCACVVAHWMKLLLSFRREDQATPFDTSRTREDDRKAGGERERIQLALPQKAQSDCFLASRRSYQSSSQSSPDSNDVRGRTKDQTLLSFGSRHSSLPPRSPRKGMILPFRGPKTFDSWGDSPKSTRDHDGRRPELQGMKGDLQAHERVVLVSGHRDAAFQNSCKMGDPPKQAEGADMPSNRSDARRELAASKIRETPSRTTGKGEREVQDSRSGRAPAQGNNRLRGTGTKSHPTKGGKRDEFGRRSSPVSSSSSLSSRSSAGLSVTSSGISRISASEQNRKFSKGTAAVLNNMYLTV